MSQLNQHEMGYFGIKSLYLKTSPTAIFKTLGEPKRICFSLNKELLLSLSFFDHQTVVNSSKHVFTCSVSRILS